MLKLRVTKHKNNNPEVVFYCNNVHVCPVLDIADTHLLTNIKCMHGSGIVVLKC